MKSTKISIILGAVTLGVVGIFATKPTKKAAATTGKDVSGIYGVVFSGASASSLTTQVVAGATAQFKTKGGLTKTLFTVAGAHKLYLRP